MSETVFHFNGIDGLTGKPLVPAATLTQVLKWIKLTDEQEPDEAKDAHQTTFDARFVDPAVGVRGLITSANAYDIGSARWGVVYHPDTPELVLQKLQPLVDKRCGLMIEYQPEVDGDDALKFRGRFDQGPGLVNPRKLPYYLLIVASPEQISYTFQYSLDAEHAVGRLYFETADEYESYVKRLLAYEDQPVRQRRVVFFAPKNEVDRATYLSANYLVEPLVNALKISAVFKQPYHFDFITGADAKRDVLLDALTRSDDQPALVFTATHGLGFSAAPFAVQQARQGALLCSDWIAAANEAPAAAIPEKAYLSGEAITAAHQCDGLIVFAFGCYTAGTPRYDSFQHLNDDAPQLLAPHPLVSYLPQRLLAQGALAFIGHVDKALDYSFISKDKAVGQDIETFQSGLECILRGDPIGYAFEAFNHRWLDLAQYVTQRNDNSLSSRHLKGYKINTEQLAYYWTAHNDARAYVIFGDPFVRLQPDRLSPA